MKPVNQWSTKLVLLIRSVTFILKIKSGQPRENVKRQKNTNLKMGVSITNNPITFKSNSKG